MPPRNRRQATDHDTVRLGIYAIWSVLAMLGVAISVAVVVVAISACRGSKGAETALPIIVPSAMGLAGTALGFVGGLFVNTKRDATATPIAGTVALTATGGADGQPPTATATTGEDAAWAPSTAVGSGGAVAGRRAGSRRHRAGTGDNRGAGFAGDSVA